MTKPPNIEGEVSPPTSAPVNQMIQLDTDTQSTSANGQSKIPKLDPKQETPASVNAPGNRGLDFFYNYINPDLLSSESHPLLSLYKEIKPAQAIKTNSDLRSSESHPLLSEYKEIKPAQAIKTNSNTRNDQSHPLLSEYQEITSGKLIR